MKRKELEAWMSKHCRHNVLTECVLMAPMKTCFNGRSDCPALAEMPTEEKSEHTYTWDSPEAGGMDR